MLVLNVYITPSADDEGTIIYSFSYIGVLLTFRPSRSCADPESHVSPDARPLHLLGFAFPLYCDTGGCCETRAFAALQEQLQTRASEWATSIVMVL